MKTEQKTTPIEIKDLDKDTLKSSLEKSDEFTSGKTTMKKWEEEESKKGQKLYILKTDEQPSFIGIVNSLLERYGICVNNYENGDKFFGYYNNNHRNGHGLYAFNPIKENNLLFSEFYFGLWKNDLKSDRGVYLWLNEKEDKKPFSDFNSANFQTFIGEMKNNIPNKGTILSKIGDDYLVYHGTFDNDFKRNGEKCFYYSSTLEELCFGTFKENEFIKGYVCVFDEDGNVKEILFYEDGNIKSEVENKEENVKIMQNFRNVIMEKDYFGEVYETFGKTLDFAQNKMNSVDMFNSKQYLDILGVASAHNKIIAFNDIEKLVHY